jgi:hypothetical protein
MNTRIKTPVHLWVIGALTLVWNLMGAFDYTATHMKLEFYMSQFSAEQLDYFYNFPAWVTAFWALAVWSSLAGSLGLLLRSAWAVWMFGLAVIGMVITTIYNFGLSNGAELMGESAVVMSLMIWVIALLLLFYARAMAKRHVIT